MKKWIKQYFENRKLEHDKNLSGKIYFLFRKFCDRKRQQDFVLDLMLKRMDLTVDELECFANIFGREAHERVRSNK